MIARLLPHPFLSLALLALWLLLTQSLGLGQILLGVVVALSAAKAMAALQPGKPRLARPMSALRLFGIVLYDVTRSNVAVARIVANEGRRDRTSGFMVVPLDLTSHAGLALLAVILTATPGTVWLDYEERKGELLIHVLDLVDEDAWIDMIKHRYERLLLEIFE